MKGDKKHPLPPRAGSGPLLILPKKGFFLHPGERLGFKGDALGERRVPGGPCCRCCPHCRDLAGGMLILTAGFHGFSPFA